MLACLPFFIFAFGIKDLQKWFLVAGAVFYPVLYCTKTGVRISRSLQQGRESSGDGAEQSEWQYGAGPWIFTGLKLGSLVGLATLLGGEIYVSTSGLGLEIVTAMVSFQSDRAYTAMFAAALVEYALWLSLTAIELVLSRKKKSSPMKLDTESN